LAQTFKWPPLVGILAGVLATIILQRGIRLFIENLRRRLSHWVALSRDYRRGSIRRTARFMQHQLRRFGVAQHRHCTRSATPHARNRLRFRWPICLLYRYYWRCRLALRTLQAVFWPDSVATEMETNSALNLNARPYIVLALALHAT